LDSPGPIFRTANGPPPPILRGWAARHPTLAAGRATTGAFECSSNGDACSARDSTQSATVVAARAALAHDAAVAEVAALVSAHAAVVPAALGTHAALASATRTTRSATADAASGATTDALVSAALASAHAANVAALAALVSTARAAVASADDAADTATHAAHVSAALVPAHATLAPAFAALAARLPAGLVPRPPWSRRHPHRLAAVALVLPTQCHDIFNILQRLLLPQHTQRRDALVQTAHRR
jgi:hypothetical protein